MATAAEIADRALRLATQFLEDSRSDIVGFVEGDGKLLYEASQILRLRAESGAHGAHTAEHLAFGLITAAHEYLRHSAQAEVDARRTDREAREA